MPPATVYLPNGQTLTVSPVFGGLYFKANDLNVHHNVFPPGWTIILNRETNSPDYVLDDVAVESRDGEVSPQLDLPLPRRGQIQRFRKPSLNNDHLYISSISNPASNELRLTTSPTRQIAMMLWATLYWYFHQEEPAPQLTTPSSTHTVDEGKPKGDWRININREGIFKGKHLLAKLERMSLISSEDSSVGLDPDEGLHNPGEGWSHMFVSRRSFWQLDPRIYLFTLTPGQSNSPYPLLSPATSRPASPVRGSSSMHRTGEESPGMGLTMSAQAAFGNRAGTPPGPFHPSSRLPTYYPPPPPQYTFTNHTRHPIRPKPPRQGETFYTRYVPSLQQYLTFRVASLSKKPITYNGPFPQYGSSETSLASAREILRSSTYSDAFPFSNETVSNSDEEKDTFRMTDVDLLHRWMNDPRVAYSWGEDGPISHQQDFLQRCLMSKHSIPVIGCFDGRPFGFFEIYWVKEDPLAQFIGGSVGDWDRGLHVLVGEPDLRGPHRVRVWFSALVHYCWITDSRTNVVLMEPRVDNIKLRKYCEDLAFYKEREVSLPHKQSNLLKIQRDAWDGPVL